MDSKLEPTPGHRKSCLRNGIQAIIKMRRQDQVAVQANIVPDMAIHANLGRCYFPNRLAVVRVSKEDHGVDEVGGRGGDHVGGVVDDLSTLAVTANAELGAWALGKGLLDQLEKECQRLC